MNYAEIKKYDIANGIGVRVSLFVSGCRHYCKGCFNSEAWDFSYGKEFTDATVSEILEACDKKYIRGLSLLGGEPLDPNNQGEVLKLIKEFKKRFPDKTIWCYSGYDLEKELLPLKIGEPEILSEILNNIDVLVDGEFIEDKKSLELRFRGSSNQKINDVKKSLEANKAVWLDGNWTVEH